MTLEDIRQLEAGSWFDPQFAGEKVPTVDEVLALVAEYRQFNILVAVDLKAHDIEQDVVRLAEQHEVLDRLLFIGRTITESDGRNQVRRASVTAQTAAVANDADEFPSALAVSNADWVYVRYLPSREQMEAVRGAGRRSFIAGSTVSGKLPDDWRHAMEVGVDAILTDYPLELRPVCRRVSAEE